MLRVSVLDDQGKPLMPSKASRVRRWLLDGEAIVAPNDLGIFQVQLIRPHNNWDTGEKYQPISVGIHPGKHYSGIGVESTKKVQLWQRNTGLVVSATGLSNLTLSKGLILLLSLPFLLR